MSLQSIEDRLNAFQETTAQISELIYRLANLKFQPGSVPLDGQGDASAELRSEIHQTLKEQDEDLELLQQEVNDLPNGRRGSQNEAEKTRLGEVVARAAQELHTARTSFRKAQLTAKHNLEQSQRAERAILLSSLTSASSSTDSLPLPRRNNRSAANQELSKDEKLIAASSDVTAALRRTHQMMQGELSRSQFAHDTLKESTAALSQLSETYSTLDTMLSSSRNLLGTLLKSQKSDTWYLETAFYILIATIGWLIFRRFIYGPGWWLVYLPLKMFYKAWMGVFTAVGLRSSRDGVFASEAAGTIISPRVSASISGSGAPTVSVDATTPRGTPAAGDQDSLVEEVGKIIDESNQEIQNSEGGNTNDVDPESRPKNPKKRMWEEPVEAKKYEEQKKAEQANKDEL